MSLCNIAVVGISCIYPGAANIKELWENILARRIQFRLTPNVRLPTSDYWHPDPTAPDKTYLNRGAFIDGFEFNWSEHRIPKTTFETADIAHWLALRVALQTLQDSGYSRQTITKDRAGVIVGNSLTGEQTRSLSMRLRWPYVRKALRASAQKQGLPPETLQTLEQTMEGYYKSVFEPITEDTLAGALSNTIAGRICNYLDLHGGGYTVDGACASSVLAITTAATALTNQEMDFVLAGGVDVSLDTFELIGFAKVGALSRSEMAVYDKRANGFIPGEGCGFVALKRLEDARRDGDYVYAVLKGWGISSDGKGGITAPSGTGQAMALRRAYAKAGYSPLQLDFIEGHGTGTPVGDKTELTGIALAMEPDGEPENRVCGMTSLKSIVGHTKAAAGIGAFIKAVLAVNQRILPPTAGCKTPNSTFEQTAKGLYPILLGEIRAPDETLRAGVSGMGFGGINSHVTLESGDAPNPKIKPEITERALMVSNADTELFVFSAPSVAELVQQIQQALNWAYGISQAELVDLANYLASSLDTAPWRAAIVAESPHHLIDQLQLLRRSLPSIQLAPGEYWGSPDQRVWIGHSVKTPKIGFLFPGQGSQRLNMARTLVERFSWAQDWVSKADGICRNLGSPKLSEYIFRPTDKAIYSEHLTTWRQSLASTNIAQPAICLTSLIWHKYLQRLGIEPDSVGGHSLGELSAFYAAGAFDGEALLTLSTIRGRAMASPSDDGTMLALACSYQQADDILRRVSDYAVIANINSPTQTVISGRKAAISRVCQLAEEQGIQIRQLPVSNAFHSELVASAALLLRQENHLKRTLSSTKAALFSGMSGERLSHGTKLDEYFANQVLHQVNFVELINSMGQECDLLVEVGPGRILSHLVEQINSVKPVPLCLPLEINSSKSIDGALNTFLGHYFIRGGTVRWKELYSNRLVRPFVPASARHFIENQLEKPFPEQLGSAPIAEKSEEPTIFRSMPVPNRSANDMTKDTLVTLLSNYFAQRGSFLAEIIRADLNNLPSASESFQTGNGESTPPTAQASSLLQKPGQSGKSATPIVEQKTLEVAPIINGTASSAPFSSEMAVTSNVQPAELYPPGDQTVGTVREKLIELISELTGYPPESITPEARLLDDLNLDSIKAGDLVASVAQEFDVAGQIDPTTLANATVQVVAEAIHQVLPETQPSPPQFEASSSVIAQTSTEIAITPVVPPSESGIGTQKEEIAATLLSLIEESTGFPRDTLSLQLRLLDDLNLDSIKAGDLVANLAQSYGVAGQLDPSGLGNTTLQDVVEAIAETLQPATPVPASQPTVLPSAPQALTQQAGPAQPGLTVPTAPFTLHLQHVGYLDSFALIPIERPRIEDNEVAIQVYAAGLNFKDVMKAKGLLPKSIMEGNFYEQHLGLECAGRVIEVGRQVTSVQPGDDVIAFARKSFSSVVATDVRLVAPKPRDLNFQQAAALPIVFLTAYYALNHLGRISENERFLVHSGAGGVGQAAIQIAQLAGAEVFATAGSEAKRAFLKQQDVQHIMNSRNLDFVAEIQQIVGNRGLDLVLNALPGQVLQQSFTLLGHYGRFLEIGKADIDQNNPIGLNPFHKNASFFGIDIDFLLLQKPDLVKALLQEINTLFNTNQLKPLPVKAFPIQQAADAFRYMLEAKHIGKIVLSFEETEGLEAPTTTPTQQTIPNQSAPAKSNTSLARNNASEVTGAPQQSSWVRNFKTDWVNQPLLVNETNLGFWQNANVLLLGDTTPSTLIPTVARTLQNAGAKVQMYFLGSQASVDAISQGTFTYIIAALSPELEESLSDRQRLASVVETLHYPLQFLAPSSTVVLIQWGETCQAVQQIDQWQQQCTRAFAASLHLEKPGCKVRSLQFCSQSDAASITPHLIAECQTPDLFSTAAYDSALSRFIPQVKVSYPAHYKPRNLQWHVQDVVLVTGGAKGITAECALAFAKTKGVKLALVGRSSQPDVSTAEHSALAQTLQRFTHERILYRYYSCDVTDLTAVEHLVSQIETDLGTITGVIHGAALNQPRRVEQTTPESATKEVAPKVLGALNLCRALRHHPLKLLAGFTSIIGVTGMPGNAWYGFSNEVLHTIFQEYAAKHPTTAVVASAFGVWQEVGMGARMGSVQQLAKQGIGAIPTQEGVQRFLQLLDFDPGTRQIIITARLAGLDTWHNPPAALPEAARFLENIQRYEPGVEIITQTHLSLENDLYLHDHVWNGSYLFPTVFGLEAMAQAVAYVTGRQSLIPLTIPEVNLERPIVVNPKTGTTIQIRAEVLEPTSAGIEPPVRVGISTAQTGFTKEHFSAVFDLNSPTHNPLEPPEIPHHATNLEPQKDLYGNVLFQGPKLQRIKRLYKLTRHETDDTGSGIFEIQKLNPAAAGFFANNISAKAAILDDAAYRDSLLQAVQAVVGPKNLYLPVRLNNLTLYRGLEDASEQVYAQVKIHTHEHQSLQGQVNCFNEDGGIIETFEYNFKFARHCPEAISGAEFANLFYQQDELQLYSSLHNPELNEPLPFVFSLVHLPGLHEIDKSQRHQAEVPYIRKALLRLIRKSAQDIEVAWSDTGKPEVIDSSQGLSLSISHDAQYLLCVAGKYPQGCDIEVITSRTTKQWLGLLSHKRLAILEQLQELGDSPDTAGTRIWAAIEAIQKSLTPGKSLDLKITHYQDDLVLLEQDHSEIYRCVATLPIMLADQQPRIVAIVIDEELAKTFQNRPTKVGNHRLAVTTASATAILDYQFSLTFKDAKNLSNTVYFADYFVWMGKIREFAIAEILEDAARLLATGDWAWVTNESNLVIFDNIYPQETVEGRIFLEDLTGPTNSTANVYIDWLKLPQHGPHQVVARSSISTTWTKVIGHGTVEPHPFPKAIQAWFAKQPIQKLSEPVSTLADSWLPQLGSTLYAAPLGPVVEPTLSEASFDTDLVDGNLVGNVYYSTYYTWQGRVRDRYFHTLAPAYFQPGVFLGEFRCINTQIKHLRETMPFDTVIVKMSLKRLFERGIELVFEYFRSSNDDQRLKLAVGTHLALWCDQSAVFQASQIPDVFVNRLVETIGTSNT